MKEKVTFKSFFYTLWRGLVQIFQWFLKVLGLQEGGKYTKVLRTIVATCITIWAACITLALLYDIFDDRIETFIARNITGDSYYDDSQLSQNVYLQSSWQDEYCRVYDYGTGRTTLKKVDWVVTSSDGDSLAVYSKNGRRGYINRFTGEISIPARYDKAWTFSEGLAAVEKDNELVFIDHDGNVVLDGDWKAHHDRDFVFKDGFCPIWNGHEHGFGVIDSTGKWFIEPSYDHITCKNGLWVVGVDGRCGTLDSQLNVLLPVEYENIYMRDGLVMAQPHNEPARLYDMRGNLVNDCVYDEVCTIYYESGQEGFCEEDEYGTGHYYSPIYEMSSCYKYSVEVSEYDYRYGLLDKNGNRITEPIYTDIESIGPELFFCEPHGMILDARGRPVAPGHVAAIQ